MMRISKKSLAAVGFCFLFLITFLFEAGVSAVPFHPDESTQLFTSGDFFLFISNPLSMVFQPSLTENPRQNYRLLDAPMIRYTVGLGLFLSGQQSQAVDWNWSQSWQVNKEAGALPDTAPLLASRYINALFFPGSLLLIFLIGRKLDGSATGVLAALLFSTNALILLHTRRAMSEGGLTFFIILFLFLLLRSQTPAWWLGLTASICVNWKLSTAPLVIVPLALFLWQERSSIPKAIKQTAIFLAAFIGVYLLLNPIFWANPVDTTFKAVEARQQLLSAQNQAMENAETGIMLNTPLKRTIGMVAHLFFAPPAIQDIGNYSIELQEQTDTYLSNPWHTLFRSFAGGSLMFFLFLAGLIMLILRIIKHHQWVDCFLFFAFCLQMGSLIAAVTLPFQRYWLPLVPFICLFSAFALNQMGKSTAHAFQSLKMK